MRVLDFRTKVYITILIGTMAVSGGLSENRPVLSLFLYLIPLGFVFTLRKWKVFFIFTGMILFGIVLSRIEVEKGGIIRELSFLVTGILLRMVPGVLMAYYSFLSTSMSDLVESLRKMHLPDVLIIPISVMFRFASSIKEDYASIRVAMRMHDLRLRKMLGNPVGYMEYKLVPLLMVSVKTADEVAVSAMTRGLIVGGQRSSISNTRLGIWDFIWIVMISFLFGIFLKEMIL